jgi:hypothetical protein
MKCKLFIFDRAGKYALIHDNTDVIIIDMDDFDRLKELVKKCEDLVLLKP